MANKNVSFKAIIVLVILLILLIFYSFSKTIESSNKDKILRNAFSNFALLSANSFGNSASDTDFWNEHRLAFDFFRVEKGNMQKLYVELPTCKSEFEKRTHPIAYGPNGGIVYGCYISSGETDNYVDCVCYYALAK